MNNLVIYGTTDFSKELHYYVEADHQGKVLAFVLDRQYIKENEFDGLPVLPYDELDTQYGKEEIEILVSLGYSKMNDSRRAIFDKCTNDGWKIASFIHSSVQNLASQIGMGNIVMDKADLRLNAKIGDGNIILTRTMISHDCCVGDFNYFGGDNAICGNVKIGNHNFLGSNCIVENRRVIKDYNLIGAGAYVNKDIECEMLVTQSVTRARKADKRMMDIFLMRK